MKPVLSWPPKADELQSDAALVPDTLYNMLAWILPSDTKFRTERVTNLPNHVLLLDSFTRTGSNSLCFQGSHQDSQACATTHDSQKPHWECRTSNSLDLVMVFHILRSKSLRQQLLSSK